MQVTIQLVRCMFRGDRPKLSSRRNGATFSKCAIRFFVTLFVFAIICSKFLSRVRLTPYLIMNANPYRAVHKVVEDLRFAYNDGHACRDREEFSLDETHSNVGDIPLKCLRFCLRSNNGQGTGEPNFERWTTCSLYMVNSTLRPRWEEIRQKAYKLDSKTIGSNAASTKTSNENVHRHISVVRFSVVAESLSCLINSTEFNFTVYDHRNGADNFESKLGPSENGRVVYQPNQCDEATGYLSRMVDNYRELSDIEVFAHEDDLCATAQGRGLLNISMSAAPFVTYIPMHNTLRTLGSGWGSPALEIVVRSLFAWAWLNQETPYTGIIATQSGGSFVTSRFAIQRRPLAFWRFLLAIARDPLISNLDWHSRYELKKCDREEAGCMPTRRAYCMYSHVYERLWGVALGESPLGQDFSQILHKHGIRHGKF